MSSKAKTIVAILVAITLAGVGYFFIINKLKPKVLPPVNTPPKTEEIDTSDWQTYRNETLGFEIKMPKEWVKSGEDIGLQPNLEDEFWQDQVGGAHFNSLFRAPISAQFNVRVKDSDLTMDDFGFRGNQDFIINGLNARRRLSDYRNDIPTRRSYDEFVLIKKNERYYNFIFSASADNIEQDIKIWNVILKTFRPIP